MNPRLLLAAVLLALSPVAGWTGGLGDPSAASLTAGGAGVERCGTSSPTAADAVHVAAALGRWRQERNEAPTGGTIRVAVHVITDGVEGQVTDRQIEDQIRVLNQGFSATGFRFELATIDRTDDPIWFRISPGSIKEKRAKQALAIDPAHRLNLYLCAPAHDQLGWATLPYVSTEEDPTHGVVVHYGTLPGGFISGFDRGRTAVHEVGHYLGLFHAFPFGSKAPGDGVEDARSEASAALGRSTGRNRPDPGEDPIRNYMGYGDDASVTEFTAGQVARMTEAVAVYRPSLLGAAPRAAGREVAPEDAASPNDQTKAIEFRGAFPNPFHSETAIRFSVPHSQRVTLRVYTLTGQLARTLIDAHLPAGSHSALLSSGDLPSGMYVLVLRVGQAQMTRSVILVR